MSILGRLAGALARLLELRCPLLCLVLQLLRAAFGLLGFDAPALDQAGAVERPTRGQREVEQHADRGDLLAARLLPVRCTLRVLHSPCAVRYPEVVVVQT